MTTLNRYHFDLGNSSTGQVGISGVVLAEDKEQALELIIEGLAEETDVALETAVPGAPGLVYANCYVGFSNIKIDNSDLTEEGSAEEESGEEEDDG